jgi:hypothetical protein
MDGAIPSLTDALYSIVQAEGQYEASASAWGEEDNRTVLK